MKTLQKRYFMPAVGIAAGVVYGVLIRLVYGEGASLASVTFLFIVPIIVGLLPLLIGNPEKKDAYRNVIFIPWLTTLAFFGTLFVLGQEDVMCILILFFPFFALITVAVLIYHFLAINQKNRKKLFAITLLPFLLMPLENALQSPAETYSVSSSVIVDAAPQTIWQNIVAVKPIEEREYNRGFFNLAGIPKPLSATVDKKALGGHRTGYFEGGLQFVETITRYHENKEVAFSIDVNQATVRNKVFDQHVLNGSYFSFVEAAYTLKTLPDGKVKLTLKSQYTLHSKINFYGRFWGDMIMEDFQDRLLQVIKNRCEATK